ncbi:MAG: glycosyltransferase [Patescibacteria group bacterium]|jgi:glycosyltransferase involved in cell wall biosynthesis
MINVGIFMPCYNVEKYINKSIESIKNQTYINWELVIIDDGSYDNTYKKALFYSSENIKVFRHNGHDGRIGKIKNEAISKFSKNYEYICHLGSDDLMPSYCLKMFVDFMDKNPDIGVCCGNFLCFNDEGKTWALPHVANSGEYDSNLLLKYMCLFPMRFYRRSIVLKVGGYSNELTSAVDYDLALKVDEITKIHRIKDPISYYYRQHPHQVSTKARPEQDINAKKALEETLKRRGIDGFVKNDAPPFIIETKQQQHYIWGK